MTYRITLFNNRFDNKTNKTIEINSWNKLVELFYYMNTKHYTKKEDAPLISSAVYKEETTRANDNVIEWSPWCALDIDDVTGTLEELKNVIYTRFGQWDFICHSTGSASVNHPKCRVILRLNRPVAHNEIKHFWFSINSRINGLADRQTKDYSRMFYIPGQVGRSFNFIFDNAVGNSVPVDLLKEKYPYVEPTGSSFLDKLPEGIREQVIAHQKSQLTNTSVTWTSYRDCKYFPKKLAKEYQHIADTGWYNCMYRIMVAIACSAIKDNYPITAKHIGDLCREFDRDNGNWYEKRPLEREATSALNYAYTRSFSFL